MLEVKTTVSRGEEEICTVGDVIEVTFGGETIVGKLNSINTDAGATSAILVVDCSSVYKSDIRYIEQARINTITVIREE